MFLINLILFIGITLAIGFFLGRFTHVLKITAIVGYIIAGLILGYIAFILNDEPLSSEAVNIVLDITLGFVGFIVGVGFTRNFIRRFGKISIQIATIESIITLIIISIGTYILTKNLSLSLILGVIGLATAPAGTVAAIQTSKGRGNLSRITMAIVGIDDGLAIILFVIVIAAAKVLLGGELSLLELISVPMIEIGGAILIGGFFGFATSYLTKIADQREDIFIIGLSSIFICIGLCKLINASSILACMVLGITLINIRPRVAKITHQTTEKILPPLFVLFFGVAGIKLAMDFNEIIDIGLMSIMGLIIVYCIYRILGKLLGATLAGKLSNAPENVRKYLGFALLSQAGVNIGLALMVSNELGEPGASIGVLVIIIITVTTIFFEIIGPIGVKYALTKAGEAHD